MLSCFMWLMREHGERGDYIHQEAKVCSLVFTFRNLPAFFCDTPLLFRPHLGHQATRTGCPCGFYGTGVTVLGFHGASSLRQRVFYSDARFSIEKEQPQLPIRSAQYASFTRRFMRICHIVSVDYNLRSQQRPRIFRYGGLFSKIKPAMTYSHTHKSAVPSARRVLASGFGMEPGVSLLL